MCSLRVSEARNLITRCGREVHFGSQPRDYLPAFWPLRASLVAQTVKGLPAMQKTWVQSLGQEDPLEKEMATHTSILAWEIPWMEKPGRLQSMGSQTVGNN